MAKFSGKIGFSTTIETAPGIWDSEVVEKTYMGDVLKASLRYTNDSKMNEDITMSKRISILADVFVNSNLHTIKYVTYMGVKWEVTEFDIQFPRVILSLGGVYNG